MICTFEAVVTGGGVIGASCAYNLALKGVKTVLLDRAFFANGASGACNGGISCFGKSGGSFQQALESLKLYSCLEDELGQSIGLDQEKSVLVVSDDPKDQELLELSASVCRDKELPVIY